MIFSTFPLILSIGLIVKSLSFCFGCFGMVSPLKNSETCLKAESSELNNSVKPKPGVNNFALFIITCLDKVSI
uniref:Uncharacterized protein n=1 Tax=Panstrongylus lignarius TaxID=156445 RepID=A0A224XTY3_9HEMI